MVQPGDRGLAPLLQSLRADRDWRAEEFVPLVYEELRRVARAQLGEVAGPHSLGPTDLAHEAWLRIAESGTRGTTWEQRSHFFHAAARAMRDVLVERHRRRDALRRGGAWSRVEPGPDDLPVEEDAAALESFADVLDRVDLPGSRQRELLKLRLLEQVDERTAAERLGVSRRTVERDWRFVKARLRSALAETDRRPRRAPPTV